MATAARLTEFLKQAFATVDEGARAAGCEPPQAIAFECRLDAFGKDIAEGPGNVVRFEVAVPAADEDEVEVQDEGEDIADDDASDNPDSTTDEDPALVADDDELERLTRPPA